MDDTVNLRALDPNHIKIYFNRKIVTFQNAEKVYFLIGD